MAVDDDDADVPESGAVFTFGRSKFNNNEPGKFWLRDETFVQVSCGDEHTALISESGKLFMFGDNAWGQLGLGHTDSVQKPSRVKLLKAEKIANVACGKSHTLVATVSGKLYAFGANGESQLGLEDDSDRLSVPKSVHLPTNSTIQMVAAGADHSALLTTSGEVYVWGCGSEGQLGLGDVKKASVPTHLPLEDKIVSVSCGYYHTALVTATGKLYTCGDKDSGKLGLSEDHDIHDVPQQVTGIPEKVVSVSCGNNHTIAVTDSGKVYTFGDGSNGQLGHGNLHLSTHQPLLMNGMIKKKKIVFSSCGESHSALISDRGVLYAFGDGRHGKLALSEENFANQFLPMLVTRFRRFLVQKVSCGGCHLLVIARPRQDSVAEEDVSEESSDEVVYDKKEFNLNDSVKRSSSNTSDLQGSFSARNRRREKQPDSISILSRTLPLLNGSKMLPPLSVSKMNSDNESNKNSPVTSKKEVLLSATIPSKARRSEDSESGDSSIDGKRKDEKRKDEKETSSPKDTSRGPDSPKPLPKPRSQTKRETETPFDTPVPTPRAKSKPEPGVLAAAVKGKEGDESGIEESDGENSENSEKMSIDSSYGEDIVDGDRSERAEVIKEIEELQSLSNAKDDVESLKASSADEKKRKEDKEEEPKKKEKKKRTGIFGRRKKIESEERESEENDSSDEKILEKEKKTKKKDKKSKKEKKKQKSKDGDAGEESDDSRPKQDSEEDAKEKKKTSQEQLEPEKQKDREVLETNKNVKEKTKAVKVQIEAEKHKDKETDETDESEEDNETEISKKGKENGKKKKKESEKENDKNQDKEKGKSTEKQKKDKELEKTGKKNSKEDKTAKTDGKKAVNETNDDKKSDTNGEQKTAEKKSRTCIII